MINNEYIKYYADSIAIYNRGLSYYKNDKIGRIASINKYNEFAAAVYGTEKYFVRIRLSENNDKVESSSCDCPYADGYEHTGCKHVVAVLLKYANEYLINELPSKEEIIKQKEEIKRKDEDKSVNDFLNVFDSEKIFDDVTNKKTAYLDIGLIISNYSYYNNNQYHLIFKIGNDTRMYSLKNVEQFLNSYVCGGELVYGKSFTYDKNVYEFDDFTKDIINLLIRASDDHYENSYSYYSTSNNAKFFNIKSDLVLDELFKIYVKHDKKLNIEFNNRNFNNIKIMYEDLPLELSLKQVKDDLVLNIPQNKYIDFTTSSFAYFSNDTIYIPTNEQKKVIEDIIKLTKKGEVNLKFDKNKQGVFLAKSLPVLKKYTNIAIDENITSKIEELVVKIYLDKEDSIVILKLEFIYNDKIINPLVSDDTSIIRDVLKEKQILATIMNIGFVKNNDYFILTNEDQIFSFVSTNIKEMFKDTEVFYSDSFKQLNVKKKVKISAGLSINQETDLLEFKFNIDDIDKKELIDIFNNLKKKKKYTKLKNGTFLDLEDTNILEVSDVMDKLDLDIKDLKNGTINLPKYKAMYLDKVLHESRIEEVNVEGKFSKLVYDISNPQDISVEVPHELNNILRDYQVFGFKWLKTLAHYGFGGILADDMGLRKNTSSFNFNKKW